VIAKTYLLLLGLFCSPIQAAIDDETAQALGRQIWQNEAAGKIELLTHWNEGESFPSLGIGHFIWYPENQQGPFEQSFPTWVAFAITSGHPPPEWLTAAPDQPCPWPNRTAFYADLNGPRLTALRQWLTATIGLQARFIARRYETVRPQLITAAPEPQRKLLQERLQQLEATPQGLYALVDYTNFKGSGLNPEERYQGQGWGLLQVLLAISPAPAVSATTAFADVAERTLERRIALSPPARGESRWLAGWQNRLNSYRATVFNSPPSDLSRRLAPSEPSKPATTSPMTPLLWILFATLSAGLLSAAAASAVLLIPDRTRARLLPALLSFAIGALLGAAFLGLLPHALAHSPGGPLPITATLLGGILLFFLLEKMVLWRHCHHEGCEAHDHDNPSLSQKPSASGALILLGDTTHNFLDGIVIGSAFLIDVRVGIMTTIAVTAHEIPQELGDFAILLHNGYSRSRALTLNLLVSLTTVAGGLLAYFAFADMATALPYLMALASASFLYVAVADLIPGLHQRLEWHVTLQQLLLISTGIGVIALTQHSLS